jgi:hypothetical protein
MRTIELNDGSAAATIHVSKGCSDGRSYVDGVVRDIEVRRPWGEAVGLLP